MSTAERESAARHMRVISSIEENGIDGFAKWIVMQCKIFAVAWRAIMGSQIP